MKQIKKQHIFWWSFIIFYAIWCLCIHTVNNIDTFDICVLVSLFEWRKRFLKNISLVLWTFFFFMDCVHFCLDWCVLAARFRSITAFNYSDCHSNSIQILHCNFHATITDKSIFLKLWERATSASQPSINRIFFNGYPILRISFQMQIIYARIRFILWSWSAFSAHKI